MIIRTIPVGQLEANCYVIADETTNKAIVVDPGDEPELIEEQIKDLKVEYVFLTHAHFDHVAAAADIKEKTGAGIAMHEDDMPVYAAAAEHAAIWGFSVDDLPEPDIFLSDQDEILVGNLPILVVHTPGHSPGGISLYIEGYLFTGDTLFAGSVGRTDLPGGSMAMLGDSFRKLMAFPADTKVLPGHGPATTIGRERAYNMFAAEFLGEE